MTNETKNINGKKYYLYLALPEAIREGEKHYLITPDYCLIYTDKAIRNKKVEEIKDTSVLPSSAWEWLLECINQIRSEYLAAHRREIVKEAAKFGEEFLSSLAANEKTNDERGTDKNGG